MSRLFSSAVLTASCSDRTKAGPAGASGGGAAPGVAGGVSCASGPAPASGGSRARIMRRVKVGRVTRRVIRSPRCPSLLTKTGEGTDSFPQLDFRSSSRFLNLYTLYPAGKFHPRRIAPPFPGPLRAAGGPRMEVAGHQVARAHLHEGRLDPRARLHRARTARVEPAAGRRLRRRRKVAVQDLPLPGPGRVGDRNRLQERPSLRVKRVSENLVARRDLDDLAEVHHRHT